MMIVGVVALTGCTQKIPNTPNTPEVVVSCDKEENCCTRNEDCEYIWFTGKCNTPEYIAKKQKEAAVLGISLGEAPKRDNVACTCEQSQCVTHN
jgi:hypothetical protein